VIPGVQQTIPYDVSQQTYTMSGTDTEGNLRGDDAIRARSVDGQEVQVDLTVIFNIDPQNINTLHSNWPAQNYVDGLLRPTSRSIVRDVVALLAAEEIYGGSRELMQDRIASELTGQLVPQGIAVTSVLVRDINFSDAFIEAIEAKQVAEQELARAQTDAQRRTTEARAQADARIETARGEAEAIRVQAAAEADALRLVSEQIAANPNLIQYLYVTNLSDNVSVVLVPSNSPFLFDASTFTNLGAEFQAPEVPPVGTEQPNN
jgi:regulator of protease activity HflC (stomatin/prohibitin superfamily)